MQIIISILFNLRFFRERSSSVEYKILLETEMRLGVILKDNYLLLHSTYSPVLNILRYAISEHVKVRIISHDNETR